jgi:hypothetical protein
MTHILSASKIDSILDDDFYKQIAWLTKTIKERPYGEKHFEAATALADKVRNAYPESETEFSPHGDKATLSKRMQASLFSFYQDIGRYHQPATMLISVSQHSFKYKEIWLPICFNMDRVEGRRLDQSGVALSPDDSQELINLALAFVHVLPTIPELQTLLSYPRGLPLMLADTRGIYFCHARNIQEDEKDVHINIIRDRSEGHHAVKDMAAPWDPGVRLYINSFIARREMREEFGGVYQHLNLLMNDPAMRALLDMRYLNFVFPENDDLFQRTDELKQLKPIEYVESARDQLPKKSVFDADKMQEDISNYIAMQNRVGELDAALIRLMRSPAYQFVFSQSQQLLPLPSELTHRPLPPIQAMPQRHPLITAQA